MIKVIAAWKGTQRHPVLPAPALRRMLITSVGFLPKCTTSLIVWNIKQTQIEGYTQNNWSILYSWKRYGHKRLRNRVRLEETKRTMARKRTGQGPQPEKGHQWVNRRSSTKGWRVVNFSVSTVIVPWLFTMLILGEAGDRYVRTLCYLFN